MAIVRNAAGRQIQTRAGIQPEQYKAQLHAAGMLTPVIRARGLDRVKLTRYASAFIQCLRTGEVSARSKQLAAELGLQHYPDHALDIDERTAPK